MASSCMVNRLVDSSVRPAAVELSSVKNEPAAVEVSSVKAAAAPVAGNPAPASTLVTTAVTSNPAPVSFPPTKLVIKQQGGGGALVSWSTSCTPMPASVLRPCTKAPGLSSERGFGPTSSSHSADDDDDDDDDALPQRTSKPPIKTYEARQRIGLKLKIKQEAGFSKVVHNTALDPVHLQPQHTPLAQVPEPLSKTRPPVTQLSVVQRTSPPTCNSTSSITISAATTHAGSGTTTSSTAPPPPASHGWSSLSSSVSFSTSSAQVNGTVEHYEVSGAKPNPTSTSTPQLTTCRLPLRKTYRKNVSPHRRPGVPGGGDMGPFPPAAPASSPPAERTVIASVKLEQQGVSKPPHTHSDAGSKGLASVEHEFYHGIKNAYQQQQPSDKEDEEDGNSGDLTGRVMGQMSKSREWAVGTFRMDQHAPGPPSHGETSWARDSSLPAKRSKSDSPDMDNASFSSGSPPLDNSLNEHLQSAIDSILNLQQGPPTRGAMDRVYAGNLSNQHPTHHRQGTSSSLTSAYRHTVTSSSSPSSSSISQHPQLGGRGQNGNLVSQTHSR